MIDGVYADVLRDEYNDNKNDKEGSMSSLAETLEEAQNTVKESNSEMLEKELRQLAVESCVGKVEDGEDVVEVVNEMTVEHNLRYCQKDIFEAVQENLQEN